MAMQFLNFPQNPLNLRKLKKNPKNLKSSWTFLLSIFIYISIFYIFNLSPSTLFSTTKFWFFISNTLILIIAADFFAFSSSKENDFYRAKNSPVPFFETQPVKNVQKTITSDKKELVDEKPQEKNHQTKELLYEPQIISIEGKNYKPEKSKFRCLRSNSDRAIIMAANEEIEEKLGLNRTLSDRHEETKLEENNEFSRMSDEELNTRVEEFIRRFNRQIRLQAGRNEQNLEVQSV